MVPLRNVEAIVENTKKFAVRTLADTGQLMPMMHAWKKGERTEVVIALATDEQAGSIGDVVQQVCRKFDLEAFVMMSDTWVASLTKEEAAERSRQRTQVRDIPGRREAVIVALVHPERKASWTATYTRDAAGAINGFDPWVEMETTSGAIPEAIPDARKASQ